MNLVNSFLNYIYIIIFHATFSDMDKHDDGVSTEMQPLTKANITEPAHNTHISFDDDIAPSSSGRWWRWLFFQDWYEFFSFLLVVISALPLILLLRYTPELAAKVKSATCLPNGDFALPGTSDIWDPKLFFSISVPVAGIGGRYAWTFTQAKAIDVIWDIGVGRGVQLLLVYVAHRVFGNVIVYYAERRNTSYAAYVAVTFQAGGFRSLWSLLARRSGNAQPRLWSNLLGIRIFSLVVLSTLYIVSLPTLLSSMTGYITIGGAFIELSSDQQGRCSDLNNCTLLNCNTLNGYEPPGVPGSLAPVWGYWHDARRTIHNIEYAAVLAVSPNPQHVDPVREYYEQYRDRYAAAERDCWRGEPPDYASLDLTTCPVLNQHSTFNNYVQPSPMLNLEVYSPPDATHGYTHWACGDYDTPFTSQQLLEDPSNSPNLGVCRSNGEYLWGFSYQLLFVTSVFQLVFALIMFALWIEAHRHLWPARKATKEAAALKAARAGTLHFTTFKRRPRDAVREAADHPDVYNSAFALVSQARQQYGDDIFTWSDEQRTEVIWRGSKGIQIERQDASKTYQV